MLTTPVPYAQFPLPFNGLTENPLAVLAKTLPESAVPIFHRQLDIVERELGVKQSIARMELLGSLVKENTAIACTWLQNRNPDKCNMRIRNFGGSVKNGFFFNSGEKVSMTTEISIW